jgi:PAS domain S-box-containing protein
MNGPRAFPATNPYELLIQGVVDYAIFMLGPDGRVASWNPGAQRIKGYAAEEIIGERFSRFYPEEERAAGVPGKALRTAAETGRLSAEGWRVRKDGTRSGRWWSSTPSTTKASWSASPRSPAT